MPPDIQQFIHTLKRRKAAYTPLAELGIHPFIKEKFLGRPLRSLGDDVAFWHRAGYDYIKLQPRLAFNPAADDLDQVGTLTAEGMPRRHWATGRTGPITDFAALERYPFPPQAAIDYRNFEQVANLLPEGMGVIGQYGDIFTMVWELMGFESFSLALYTNPELVQALFDIVGTLVYSMFEFFARCEVVDVLWYSDDIAFASGLMLSPDHLRQYFFPWLKKIGDLARAAHKPLIYHSDGLLFEVIDDIIACGVDALHPIEPKAMDIVEVKQRAGDRLALIGNIDVDLLARGTPEAVRRRVIDNIEKVGYNGGYCVGSGNSIPEYVNFENYLAMLEAVYELNGAAAPWK